MRIDIDYDESRTDVLRLNDREVTSPAGKLFLQAVIVVTLGLVVPVTILLGMVLGLCSWPLHLLLRAAGRKGFGSYDLNKGLELKVDRDSFRKVR